MNAYECKLSLSTEVLNGVGHSCFCKWNMTSGEENVSDHIWFDGQFR